MAIWNYTNLHEPGEQMSKSKQRVEKKNYKKHIANLANKDIRFIRDRESGTGMHCMENDCIGSDAYNLTNYAFG